jgi:hypothetical protein
VGLDFWPVLKDARGSLRYRLCGRYPETSWGQLSMQNCTYALFADGPDGALATVRSACLGDSIQQMEARIAIERVLLDEAGRARLGDELVARCNRMLEDRRRLAYFGSAWDKGCFLAGADVPVQAAKLYDLAAEVAARTKAGK